MNSAAEEFYRAQAEGLGARDIDKFPWERTVGTRIRVIATPAVPPGKLYFLLTSTKGEPAILVNDRSVVDRILFLADIKAEARRIVRGGMHDILLWLHGTPNWVP